MWLTFLPLKRDREEGVGQLKLLIWLVDQHLEDVLMRKAGQGCAIKFGQLLKIWGEVVKENMMTSEMRRDVAWVVWKLQQEPEYVQSREIIESGTGEEVIETLRLFLRIELEPHLLQQVIPH